MVQHDADGIEAAKVSIVLQNGLEAQVSIVLEVGANLVLGHAGISGDRFSGTRKESRSMAISSRMRLAISVFVCRAGVYRVHPNG